MNTSALKSTLAIVDRVLEEHNPSSLYVAFSGGRDSAVLLDVMFRAYRDFPLRVMSIDTGLGADGWLWFVTDWCMRYDIAVEIVQGCGRDWYRKNVADYGFGYSRSHHVVYYRMLKQRAVEKHVKSVKQHYFDRIVYCTGVRRDESAQRAKTAEYMRHGARVTCNPIVEWTDYDIRHYLSAMLPDYANHFYDLYGSSGDCFCGWTCTNRVDDFESDSPDLYTFLGECNSLAIANGMHEYGVNPSKTAIQVDTGQMDMFNDFDFCVACRSERNG